MIQRVMLRPDFLFYFLVLFSWPWSCVEAGLCFCHLTLKPHGVRRGRPHSCLWSAEAPGVFLIRNRAGSHYWALMLSSLSL